MKCHLSFFPLSVQWMLPQGAAVTPYLGGEAPSITATGCVLSGLLHGISTVCIHTYGICTLAQICAYVSIPHPTRNVKGEFSDIMK